MLLNFSKAAPKTVLDVMAGACTSAALAGLVFMQPDHSIFPRAATLPNADTGIQLLRYLNNKLNMLI